MQSFGIREDLAEIPSTRSPNAEMPLVSVIIVNYNYGVYLKAAVASVVAQTYRPIECVLVDDASSDDSADVIAALLHEYPEIIAIRREVNGGQTSASIAGLDASKGNFVSFLDSDDELHPSFIATHVGVHLALRTPIGFSCSDMVQIQDGRIINGGDLNVGIFLTSRSLKPAKMRKAAISNVVPGMVFAPTPPPAVYDVSPNSTCWPWSTTSAIVYRRATLEMFSQASNVDRLRSNTDAFFCWGINAISGSVVIDCPLGYYRHHTGNVHSRRPPLKHTINFGKKDFVRRKQVILETLIDHAIRNATFFSELFWLPFGYAQMVSRLLWIYPKKGSKQFGSLLMRSVVSIFRRD